jgi:hypothetical protein
VAQILTNLVAPRSGGKWDPIHKKETPSGLIEWKIEDTGVFKMIGAVGDYIWMAVCHINEGIEITVRDADMDGKNNRSYTPCIADYNITPSSIRDLFDSNGDEIIVKSDVTEDAILFETGEKTFAEFSTPAITNYMMTLPNKILTLGFKVKVAGTAPTANTTYEIGYKRRTINNMRINYGCCNY